MSPITQSLVRKVLSSKQEAVTVIGTLMPQVKGVSGLGGRASAPKGADVLKNPYGGTCRATSGGDGRTDVQTYMMDSPIRPHGYRVPMS
jgi:hypothetical protein